MKDLQHKAKMYKHRFLYWADRNPNEAGFYMCLAGLVVSELLHFAVM